MMPQIMKPLLLLLLLQSFCSNAAMAAGEGIIITEGDLEALLAIKQALLSSKQMQQGALLRSWNASSRLGACQGQWEGIKCANGGRVIVLQLPFKSLSGSLSPRIADLVYLRKLNLHTNLLAGPIPSSLASLPSLHALYLHQNHFTGAIPAGLFNSPTLQRLDLSHNNFSASPFSSINSSSSLTFLNLAYNSFTGPVPAQLDTLFPTLTSFNLSHNSFNQSLPPSFPAQIYSVDISYNYFNGSLPATLFASPSLTYFNCSYNRLSGSVSSAIAKKFNSSAFIGNPGLCGYDPSVACAFQGPSITSSPTNSSSSIANISNSEKTHRHRFSTATFLFIVIGSVVAASLLLCLIVALLCIFCGKNKSQESSTEKGAVSSTKTTGFQETKATDKTTKDGASAVGGGKLVHFDGAFKFTADGLLCATAEVLGKSTYGTVYKATFEDGNEVAVKRLREGIVKSQRDFEMEVNMLGRVRHPNLLALRGYYWGPKNEKLLIFDFMPGGSLAAFLHARGPETPMTWQTRLNIATGAARGLAHLHNQERIVHGNLTSSNILLDARMNAKLADYGLSRLMTSTANANVIAAANALGYRAPELTKLRKASTKTDVYSFGVVLLELLTGKSPAEAASGDTTATAGMDLPEWVASIVKEEWTNEIFDLEIMKGSAPSEDDLINTLQLAMNCVTPLPSARPDMDDVARQLHDTLHKPDPSRQHPHYATTTSASSESAS